MKLNIFVGTVTGNAQYAAQAIEMQAQDLGFAVEVRQMDHLDISAFSSEAAIYLICTSTFGSGNVPDNAQGLYESLDATPKDLSHVRYGVFALGDQGSYPNTFANGGVLFDERLAGLGAVRIGDVFKHDASSGQLAEEAAADWASSWLPLALKCWGADSPIVANSFKSAHAAT